MWKVVTKEQFQNQEFIFPAAQESVLQIVKNAMSCDSVKKVIAFGSCTESRFSLMSEIDIYVEQENPERVPLARGLRRGVDYWTQYSVDDGLMREIEQKGVTVYER